MTERARDYVARHMAENYTPEELEVRRKATDAFLESLPEEGDAL